MFSVTGWIMSQKNDERGTLEQVVMSIFEPGVNSKVILVMNVSLIALVFVLFGLAIITGGNLHVIALIFIASGLFASLQWY